MAYHLLAPSSSLILDVGPIYLSVAGLLMSNMTKWQSVSQSSHRYWWLESESETSGSEIHFIMYTQRCATSKNEKIRKRRDDDVMMCFKIAIANWPSASSQVLRKHHSTQDILGPFRPRLWTCALRLWSQHHVEMHVCFFHGFNSLLRLSNCHTYHTSRCIQIYYSPFPAGGRLGHAKAGTSKWKNQPWDAGRSATGWYPLLSSKMLQDAPTTIRNSIQFPPL